ncbi:iron-containing alcohol dehydrogenase family protein [Halosegnis marinus]|uniref:Iron-containing alcohol dehydrogenase family protein n=1 Tax=Halosegnis marinus TaxID=3034023 RepID=A0ABD5ZMC9_9EURY|nr:iron-containing alcohol dehydrogenase family protein [Halosegnis sp. DT85]
METDPAPGFEFDYAAGKIHSGPGRVARLGDELDARGYERALVVTGRTVGSTPAVMGPVRDALGDRLVGEFAGTTPGKYLAEALSAAERVRREDADALVAVGSGSSLDVAKAAAALCSHDGPLRDTAERMVARGEVVVAPDGGATPTLTVPTTLAGADLSAIAGSKLALDPEAAPDDELPNGDIADRRLMPEALFYDTDLFRETPAGVLAASAMNGFDKAVEALYSPYSTPITDGTASRAVGLVTDHAGALAGGDPSDEQLAAAVDGVLLAQYGISTPGRYRVSVIHAFAHGFSHDYEAHQGTAHGILAPHVLRYVFEHVDGRRELLAEAFGADAAALSPDEQAEAVVAGVESVRDALDLPARLRTLEGFSRGDMGAVAAEIADDRLLDAAPRGLDLDTAAIESVLERAW